MAESKLASMPVLEPINFDFNNFELNKLYMNVTFALIPRNANYRISNKEVINFNPTIMENNIGIFKIEELEGLNHIVFERYFPNSKSKATYNLANTAQTYYTKVETPLGDKYIHPFDLKLKIKST